MLMMIPLRRSLIVKEHGNLPYPEGTACASVLIAGEKGGDLAQIAFQGVGFAFVYALLQKILKLIAETPALVTSQTNKYFPSATLNGDITPEYLGVGYIIGPRIAGVLVAGGVLAWLGLIPLLASLVPADTIAVPAGEAGLPARTWRRRAARAAGTRRRTSFVDTATAIYRAYVRQIGAGAVAAGGLITLLKTLPTIVASFKEQPRLAARRAPGGVVQKRTERDLPITVVLFGSLGLILVDGGPALPARAPSWAG